VEILRIKEGTIKKSHQAVYHVAGAMGEGMITDNSIIS